MARLLTLLTDFGTGDYYVAAVKGTVLRLAPGTQLIDLSHEVAPGDVEGASDLLAAAAPSFPPGTCHLAVVDPGVGSARRILVVQAGDHYFVAPDNGLLSAPLGAGGAAWEVTREDLFMPGAAMTFHGRDRLAPIAAALLRGDHPNALGRLIDDAVRLAIAPPRRQRDGERVVLLGRVTRVDRFGNVVTDLPAAWLREAMAPRPLPVVAEVAGRRASRLVGCYAELAGGEAGLLVSSLDTLELALRGEGLAARWNVSRGAAVRIEIG